MTMIVKGRSNIPFVWGLMHFSNSNQMVCQQKVRNSECGLVRMTHFWRKVLNLMIYRIH